MNVGLALLLAAVLVPPVARRLGGPAARWLAAAMVGTGIVLDAVSFDAISVVAGPADHVALLGLAGGDTATRWALLGALLWCGPAADVLVRGVLRATRLPAPELAESAGLRAGRWIGRLERWLLLLCIAGGQPALAVIPIGGKALFRYAEVLAEARAERPRLLGPADGDATGPPRDALVDYVIVGSLASWTQAIALGLLVVHA